MPKEIKAVNDKTTAVYRFIGKNVFLKCNNMQYAAQLIAQIQSKGGSVKQGRNWLQCDLIGEHSVANLGTSIIDVDQDSDDTIENKFCEFFKATLEKAQFKVEVNEIWNKKKKF